MLATFVRQHWRAYASAAAMLSCIAAMTVWIPRQVGHVVDALVAVCVLAPLMCAVLDFGQPWGGWQIGLELLLLNGVLTWAGLWLLGRGRAGAA